MNTQLICLWFLTGRERPQRAESTDALTQRCGGKSPKSSEHLHRPVCERLTDVLLCVCAADEVPAPAAEVSGVSGGREDSRSAAGAPSRTHAPEVQH